ncbi:MAG: CopG family transcriptional regulator [Deltaproteobacteria bacterium]|nr:MAG: CopG family transcriptional regulator [Deltaproteobacteria bacterium]
MKDKEFDQRFDNGEDITSYLDMEKSRRVNQAVKQVKVDFPVWVVDGLDNQAKRLGITRQSLVKMWVADRLERMSYGGMQVKPHDEV